MRTKYTNEDIEFLRKYYPIGDWDTIFARFPHLDKDKIYNVCHKRGISANYYERDKSLKTEYYKNMALNRKKWTNEEIKILENNHLKLDSFVLQPQNNELKLKMWLNKNNYEIINDFIVKDRHIYYNVMKIKLGKCKKQNLFNLKFGKENFYGNKDFYEYLKYTHNKLQEKLMAIPKSKQKEIKKENNVAISKTRYGIEENSKIN